MKNCPKCCVETNDEADWCWHCGYSFEEAEAGAPSDEEAPSRPGASNQRDPGQ